MHAVRRGAAIIIGHERERGPRGPRSRFTVALPSLSKDLSPTVQKLLYHDRRSPGQLADHFPFAKSDGDCESCSATARTIA